MEYALISCKGDLDLVEKFKYHMILAWTLENKTFLNFYKNLTRSKDTFLILDNGANESKLANTDRYINYANELKINEVQAPDCQLESKATIGMTNEFLKNCLPRFWSQPSIMAIPQGKSYDHFMFCWTTFVNNPNINTIGLGYKNVLPAIRDEIIQISPEEWKEMGIEDVEMLQKILEPETFRYLVSRIYWLKRKVNFDVLRANNKKIHLLGLWNPIELKYYKNIFSKDFSLIRSCDSAAPVQSAQAYVQFDPNFGLKTKCQPFLEAFDTLGKGQRIIAENNIRILEKWL